MIITDVRASIAGVLFAAGAGLVGAAEGCAFFTPARTHEILDIACIIAHYELPDLQLGQVCNVPTADVVKARAQAKASMVATVARERSDAGLSVDDTR